MEISGRRKVVGTALFVLALCTTSTTGIGVILGELNAHFCPASSYVIFTAEQTLGTLEICSNMISFC